MNTLGSFFGELFKNFPVAAIVIMIGLVYALWYSTGGVERGEERRANGENGLFVEVSGVPSEFEEDELFGAFPSQY